MTKLSVGATALREVRALAELSAGSAAFWAVGAVAELAVGPTAFYTVGAPANYTSEDSAVEDSNLGVEEWLPLAAAPHFSALALARATAHYSSTSPSQTVPPEASCQIPPWQPRFTTHK